MKGDGESSCEYNEQRARKRDGSRDERALARLVEHHLSLCPHLSIAVATVKSHIFCSNVLAARLPLKRSERLMQIKYGRTRFALKNVNKRQLTPLVENPIRRSVVFELTTSSLSRLRGLISAFWSPGVLSRRWWK